MYNVHLSSLLSVLFFTHVMTKKLLIIIHITAYVLLGSLIYKISYGLATTTRDLYKNNIELEPNPNMTVNTKIKALANWQRPTGAKRVALQAGHWKAGEAPEELKKLRLQTGAQVENTTELTVNLQLAEKIKNILERKGILVDVLPTTIPPNYWADVFVALHADGNNNPNVTGYKVAAPAWDLTGQAGQLAETLQIEYGKATSLSQDPNVTEDMTGYYAFKWWRYEHALHPMTTAVIFEAGYLTNSYDREILIKYSDQVAQGIAQGILKFFRYSTSGTLVEQYNQPT